MEDNLATLPSMQQQPEEATPVPKPASAPSSRLWAIAVALGFISAVIAWVAMAINEYASFWCAVAAFVISLIAVFKVGKGMWRNIAITSLVGSGSLLIVYGIFYFGISYLLNSL